MAHFRQTKPRIKRKKGRIPKRWGNSKGRTSYADQKRDITITITAKDLAKELDKWNLISEPVSWGIPRILPNGEQTALDPIDIGVN